MLVDRSEKSRRVGVGFLHATEVVGLPRCCAAWGGIVWVCNRQCWLSHTAVPSSPAVGAEWFCPADSEFPLFSVGNRQVLPNEDTSVGSVEYPAKSVSVERFTVVGVIPRRQSWAFSLIPL